VHVVELLRALALGKFVGSASDPQPCCYLIGPRTRKSQVSKARPGPRRVPTLFCQWEGNSPRNPYALDLDAVENAALLDITPDTLDLDMAKDFEIAKLQGQAFIDNLGQSMVFLFHVDHAGKPGSGAAVLVSLGGCTYLATALHNFVVEEKDDIASIVEVWNETKFHVREVPLLFHDPLFVPPNSAAHKSTDTTTARRPFIDRAFDLIAVRLKPEEIPPHVHPIDLEHRTYVGEVEAGAVLTTLGLPIGGAQRSEHGPKLVPYKFSTQFDPNVPKPNVSSKDRSDDYLLYPYTGNVGAPGYSGAPVWISLNADTDPLWKANPLIVGIVLKRFRTSGLIQAVRIKHLITLLEADISPEASASLRAG
jgi:hypothetical protein